MHLGAFETIHFQLNLAINFMCFGVNTPFFLYTKQNVCYGNN